MSKVIRYIDTTQTGEADYWHPEGLLPTHMRKSEHLLDVKMEKTPVSFLLDDKIAKEPWIVEINLGAGKGHMDLLDPFGGFWRKIPDLVKHRLHEGHGTLILNYYLEGMTGHVLEMVYRYIREHKIPTKQTVYLTSAVNIQKDHDVWCEQHRIPLEQRIQCWGTSAWEWTCGVYSYHRTQNEPIQREKKYLFLNRRLRPHRVLFPCLLASAGVLDKGLVSYFADDDMGDTIEKNHNYLMHVLSKHPSMQNEYLKGYQLTRPNLPYIVDTTDYKFNHAVTMAESLYERTYFSVVSETFFISNGYSDSVFFSEKVYKPMSQLHPFVLIARPGSLQALRHLGYQTFSSWIDETYDTIEDDVLRAEAITKEVTRLANLPDSRWQKLIAEMQPTLLHNQKRLRNNASEIFQRTELKNILNYQTEATPLIQDRALSSDKLPYPVIVTEQGRPSYLLSLLKRESVYHVRASEGDVFTYAYPWFYLRDIDTNNSVKQGFWDEMSDFVKHEILYGKAYLLLSNIHEGETEQMFCAIHELLEQVPGLDARKVILLSGAVNIANCYNRFTKSKQLSKRIQVHHANIFRTEIRENWLDKHKERYFSFLERRPRQKKFICLNRQPKPQRLAMLGMLEERNLLDAGFVTCHMGKDGIGREWANAGIRQSCAAGYFSANTAAKLKSRLPMIIDSANPELFPTYVFMENLYSDSYFSIVNETFCLPKTKAHPIFGTLTTDNSIFPTEKIYKPILFGHPFIVASTPHFLKEMRKQGYHTFPEFFDESYDDIEDDKERLMFVTKEAARVAMLPDSELMRMTVAVRKKLGQNQKLLLEKHYPTELVNFLNRIADDSSLT